jgi:hypothetical protein
MDPQTARLLRGKVPNELSTEDAKAFLTFLAVKENASVSSQNQAFNALLFLFRNVFGRESGKNDLHFSGCVFGVGIVQTTLRLPEAGLPRPGPLRANRFAQLSNVLEASCRIPAEKCSIWLPRRAWR